MAPTHVPVRLATLAFDRVLRLMGPRVVRDRHLEAVEVFRASCAATHERAGASAVLAMTIAELWDLVRNRLAPRRTAARVSLPSPRPGGRRPHVPAIGTDIRHALRALVARRAETLLAVLLLTLGLSTSGAIFAVTDALLVRPVPFPHAERLVQLVSTRNGGSIMSMPRDLAMRWLDRRDLFATAGLYRQSSALITSGGDPELIGAADVSAGLFEALGVAPMAGRFFTPEEGAPGADRVVIISEEVWRERLGGTPNPIGQRLRINDIDRTVVGVMDDGFRFPYARQRVWLPYSRQYVASGRESEQVTLVGRMAPGLTREQLTERVTTESPAYAAAARRPWKMAASTLFLDDVLMDSATRRSIWLLFAATVLLMLTVCANVANLGLSQALGRTRDAAIRSALGASRWRLVRAAMIEQLVTGAIALALAVPLTAAALDLAVRLLPQTYTVSSLNPVDIDLRLILVMAALALAAPLVAGLVPALAGSRPAVLDTLRQEGRSVTGSRAARVFRKGLVVVEVACSVVLLVSAALLVRSFLKLQAVDPGFDSHNLISVNLGFPAAVFPDGPARELYLDTAVARLRAVPGVTAVTAASGVPPDNGGIGFGAVEAEGGPTNPHAVFSMYGVAPDFFQTVGLRITSGRALTASDSANDVVVSASMAAATWPTGSAVGRRFRWEGSAWMTVVGVVATVRESSSGTEAWPQIYWLHQREQPSKTPPTDAIPGWRRVAVRVADASTAVPAIRAALREVNAGVLVSAVDRVDDLLAKDLDKPRFLLVLMLVFAGAGLVLAAIGVYSVLSCLVAEQLREYGIRLMLGAPPQRLARVILTQAVLTTTVGLGIGLAAAFSLGKTIDAVLFDVDPRDAVSYAVVAVTLLGAAICAAWPPAARAARADPNALLR